MGPGSNEATLNFKTTSDVASLQALQQSMGGVNQWLETLNLTMSRSIAVQTQMATSLSRMTQANDQHAQATNNATKSNNAFLDTIMKGVAAGAEFAAGYLSVSAALGMVGNAFEFVTGKAQKALMEMQKFLEQSFQLADSAQRMEYLWMYQYGGPQNGGAQISSQLAAWIPNFAMNSPYTMMQIMGAVGPLSQMGLSFKGLQRYLPLISDLAATHTSIFGGGDMLPINYAALAVMEATKGYSRRLLMELQIRPNELSQYGLKFVGDKESGQIANPEQFLPALEAYAKDKGYTGASKRMAHETWTGLMASMTDREQAFRRRMMGENIPDPDAGSLTPAVLKMIQGGDIAGAMKAVGADQASLKSYDVTFSGAKLGKGTTLSSFQDALEQFSQDKFYSDWAHSGPNGGTPSQFRQGTIFSVLLKGLQDFSQWWDAHQSTIDQISKFVADVGGKLLELGRNSVSNALTSAFQGFTKAFTGGEALQGIGNNIMKFLTDPRNQDLIRRLGTWAGTTAGQGLSQFAQWAGPQVNNAISWMSDPKNQKGIADTAKMLSDTLGSALHGIVTDLALVKKDWDEFTVLFEDSSGKDPAPIKFFKDLGTVVGGFFLLIGNKLKAMLDLLDDVLQAFKLLGDYFATGHIDTVAMMNLDAKIMKDMTSFITAGIVNINIQTYNEADLKPLIQARQDYTKKHPPGHGPIGGPTSPDAAFFGGSVTQNNNYNIQGATSLEMQRVVDDNAKKVNKMVGRAVMTPGFWSNNQVGVF